MPRLTDEQWADIDRDALKFWAYLETVRQYVKVGFTPDEAVEMVEHPVEVEITDEPPHHPSCRTTLSFIQLI